METTGFPSSDAPEWLRSVRDGMGFEGQWIKVSPDLPALHAAWELPERCALFIGAVREGVELVGSTGPDTGLAIIERWVRKLARGCPTRRFVHVHRGEDGRLTVLAWRDHAEPRRQLVSQPWNEELGELVGEVELHDRERLFFRICDLLEREETADRYFRAFREQLFRLESAWVGFEDPGAVSPTERRYLTLALLCRLMFVAIVSESRGLAGHRQYLRWTLEQPRQSDIFRDRLRPLFFEGLNTPYEERAESARRMGELPYLNGGLFEPTSIEIANPCLTLPDEVLAEAIYELFERYTFCASEVSDEAERRAQISPRMLGQVFEALMHDEERRSSGSFYTPPELVTRCCVEALVKVVAEDSPIQAHWLAELFAGREADMDPLQVESLEVRLDNLLILDPSVGSGAFLLGVADLLLKARLRLDALRGTERSEHDLLARILTRNLYGVDIKAGAVMLCELRLWLRLVSALKEGHPLSPLPNLDHHIRQGNTLTAPPGLTWDAVWSTEDGERDARYAGLHGREKAAAASQRRAAEIGTLQKTVNARRSAVEQAVKELVRLRDSKDLFGQATGLSATQLKSLAELSDEILALNQQLEALSRGELPYFSYAAAFPNPARRGGFDLVVGNPPWVRVHDVPKRERGVLKQRYVVAKNSGSYSQFDLASLFIERSLELVRTSGLVGLLVPSKVFRTKAGESLRQHLADRHAVLQLFDYSNSPIATFQASNYPAWLLVARDGASRDTVQLGSVLSTGEFRCVTEERTSLWFPGSPGNVWSVLSSSAKAALAAMSEDTVDMESYGLTPKLGVKTGANSIFLAAHSEVLENDTVALTMKDGTRLDNDRQCTPLISSHRRSFRPLSSPCDS
ncbi:MAG: Eco57I restriction-modification methylase domain-containing protein, partial [Myxococcales bacterium]|nr:Eco57I restriction-modification methylase domain-containing protein [Myxococcales bacterium]